MEGKIIDLLWQQGPLVVISAVIFILGYREVWRWGKQVDKSEKIWQERLDSCEKEKDWWKNDSLTQRVVTASALKIADEMTDLIQEMRRAGK